MARHLDSFAYVMLAQLGMPLQPVLAFVESSCLERGVGKDTKNTVLAHVSELAQELTEQDLEDEERLYDDKKGRDHARDSIKNMGSGLKDVGSSARQGPKSFTKSVVGNTMGLTKGVTKNVAKGAGKSVVYSAKKGGNSAKKVGLKTGQRLAGGGDSPRVRAPKVAKVAEGQVMSGFLWKQIGHGVVQELDLPGAINVGKSRRWKRFWFVLKQSALMIFNRPKDRDPIMRLWLHEQTLVSLDETSRSFTLSSSWRRVNLRMAKQGMGQDEAGDGDGDSGGGGGNASTAQTMGKDYRRWTQGLTVSTQQAKSAYLESSQQSKLHAASRGLRLTPVPKDEADVRAIVSFASELWMKHDAMKMMEETNKMFHEQIKEDMRAFVVS
eukprot:SAG22_NODE_271_length_13227_cov_34.282983_6_plen_382_part_00